MAIEIKLNQKLSQSLVMTPQLQQAIKLLQLGRIEYLEEIEKELLANPVLEEVQQTEPIERIDSSASENSHDVQNNSHNENSSSSISISSGTGDTPSEYYYQASNRNEDGERPSFESTYSKPAGLDSHLFWQLGTSELNKQEKEISAYIIGNLDRNGYLNASSEEISIATNSSIESVESVLKVIQSFDPPGIAARDLKECLLIQLEQLGMQGTLAWKIVEEHLADLELRRYEPIAKKYDLELEEVYDSLKEIQKLEPRPGRPFVDEEPIYITPDVYIKKVGENYLITMNEFGLPKVRLNPIYQELLNNPNNADKNYLQDKLKQASWLLKSIEQRQQTIYKVTKSIVKFQREFLEQGVSALRPLVLKEVAEDVGMHESTVSRVTTNKYVHTPQGVYELKFFFTSGLRSGAGEISSESVKERIRDLVAKENPKKPLSDQALVAMLKAEGVDIARRTVAKYREMLNILSSSRRKKVF